MKTDTSAVNIDRDIGDFHYKVDYGYDAGVGLDERVVNYISDVKQDPDWVREFRGARSARDALMGRSSRRCKADV